MRYSLVTFTFGEERNALMDVLIKSWKQFRDIEFIVVEKGSRHYRWVEDEGYRYLHFGCEADYHRSASFNAGVAIAQGEFIVLHDNDLPLPSDFFKHLDNQVDKGYHYFSSYRKIVHLLEPVTRAVIAHPEKAQYGYALLDSPPAAVREYGVRGVYGGSTTIAKTLFNAVGGFHQEIQGWGGEDNEFELRVRHLIGDQVGIAEQDLVHLYHPPIKPLEENPHLKHNYALVMETLKDPQRVIDRLTREMER